MPDSFTFMPAHDRRPQRAPVPAAPHYVVVSDEPEATESALELADDDVVIEPFEDDTEVE